MNVCENNIYNCDCLYGLKNIDDESIDLVVTSPPYDDLRKYSGFSWDFEETARELFRVVKKNGVVVWIVADSVIKGSETGNSFRQALFFKACGFDLYDRGNKRIEEAYNNKEVLKATVSQVLDGGLSVIVDEVRIFIPASLVSDSYEKDLSKYAGQEIEFVISEYNPKRRRYIGDRRQLLVAQKAELQKELFERIHEGDIVEGVVKNVTDFGAFIDLGGADGLLHISEMSCWVP